MIIDAVALEQHSPQRQGPTAWLALAGWMVLAGIAAAAGGVASLNAREFDSTLMKPGWAPPGWLFGPVWSVLYLLIGIAAWLVWRERRTKGHSAVGSCVHCENVASWHPHRARLTTRR